MTRFRPLCNWSFWRIDVWRNRFGGFIGAKKCSPVWSAQKCGREVRSDHPLTVRTMGLTHSPFLMNSSGRNTNKLKFTKFCISLLRSNFLCCSNCCTLCIDSESTAGVGSIKVVFNEGCTHRVLCLRRPVALWGRSVDKWQWQAKYVNYKRAIAQIGRFEFFVKNWVFL